MHLITRIKAYRWSAVVGTVELSCLIVLLACGSGCKSGASMGTSWGSLGMGGPDPATLAEAPEFDGDTTKPSATAQPYPTTSTPDSYALQPSDQALPGDQALPAMVAATPPATQAPVTYGSTPSTAQPTTPDSSAVASTSPQPQVGPYQSVPAAVSSAPDALASAPQGPDTTNRFSNSSAPTGTAPPPMASTAASGRFSSLGDQRVAGLQPSASMGGSRFSSPPAVNAPVSPAFSQTAPNVPSTGSRFSAMSDFPAEAPPASFPEVRPNAQQSVSVTTPSEESPSTVPQVHQSLEAPMDSPPVPPTSRRPDPGYRPGGTSSYQPASPIIVQSPDSKHDLDGVGGQPNSVQDITPASFEAQLGSPQIPN